MSRTLLSAGLLCLAISGSPRQALAQQPQILVFAAASLTDAMQEAG